MPEIQSAWKKESPKRVRTCQHTLFWVVSGECNPPNVSSWYASDGFVQSDRRRTSNKKIQTKKLSYCTSQSQRISRLSLSGRLPHQLANLPFLIVNGLWKSFKIWSSNCFKNPRKESQKRIQNSIQKQSGIESVYEVQSGLCKTLRVISTNRFRQSSTKRSEQIKRFLAAIGVLFSGDTACVKLLIRCV